MTSAAIADAAIRPDPLDIFRLRALAKARLVREGELDLHEAVDGLQAAAERDGLVAELGQDEVQRLLAELFAPAAADAIDDPYEGATDDPYEGLTGGFRAACIAADRAIVERTRATPEPEPAPPHAAASTLDAADYLVMQGDGERLRQWLARHSAEERAAIREHMEARLWRSHSET